MGSFIVAKHCRNVLSIVLTGGIAGDGFVFTTRIKHSVVADLSEILANYDVEALQNAFVKVVDLINSLATETAR